MKEFSLVSLVGEISLDMSFLQVAAAAVKEEEEEEVEREEEEEEEENVSV
jgi:hypothetical protein